MSDKNWAFGGNKGYLVDTTDNYDKLPVAVYKLLEDQYNRLYLSKVQDSFTFPHKVYGLEEGFIKRVIKTYQNTTGNMGILLNGIKGSGKSVVAQRIANESSLPVIIIPDKYAGTVNFLNDLREDVVILIDEYEKIYPNYDGTILTVMDGVMKSEYRKMFILTTNELHISQYMTQRPSRIRYLKTFQDLPREVIEEVVNDLLQNKELKAEFLDFTSTLEIITIDVLQALIQEVNIHNEPPQAFKSYFNVKSSGFAFNVLRAAEGGELKLTYVGAKVKPAKFDEDSINNTLYINDVDKGEICEVLGTHACVVEDYSKLDKDDKPLKFTYSIESVEVRHKAFLISPF